MVKIESKSFILQDIKGPQKSDNIAPSPTKSNTDPFSTSKIGNSVSDIYYTVNSLNASIKTLENYIENLEKTKNVTRQEYENKLVIQRIADNVANQMRLRSSSALLAQANVSLERVILLLE
ncbi:MAG: hypothetical protein N3C60_06945 [Calditerrivibrio sp.]|nr:hypothetical protein [Calditerrivibrio sp.]